MLQSVPIENIDVNIIMVLGVIVLVAGWAFTFGVFYSKLNEVSMISSKIFKEVTNQDERIDAIEKDHVTREEYTALKEDVLTIKVEHKQNHKE